VRISLESPTPQKHIKQSMLTFSVCSVKTADGVTAFELAVRKGKNGSGSDIVGLLIRAGAEANYRRIAAKAVSDTPVFNEGISSYKPRVAIVANHSPLLLPTS